MQQTWPADRVERWSLDRVLPYARNARTHSASQIDQIAASMREWGWTNPVLVDEAGMIIAGHGRIEAARKLGLSEAPVMVATGWSEAKKRAYVIADNKVALNAGWNEELLAAELTDLHELAFDMNLVGFEVGELERLLGSDGAMEREDDVPATPETPVSRAGDLWLLGRHRLLCGDATCASDVARLLGDVRPHLMVTDPPYGVEYDPAWRNESGASQTRRTGKVLNDDRADWREAWALFPGEVAYVWHGALHAGTVADSLNASGSEIRSQIIWSKERLVLSRGHYHWQHEPCWYAVKKGGSGAWAGDRKQTTIWPISAMNQDAETVHGTQKPVECMRRPMLNNSSTGQAVYEPFSGSGTQPDRCRDLWQDMLGDGAGPGLCRCRGHPLGAADGRHGGAGRRDQQLCRGELNKARVVPSVVEKSVELATGLVALGRLSPELFAGDIQTPGENDVGPRVGRVLRFSSGGTLGTAQEGCRGLLSQAALPRGCGLRDRLANLVRLGLRSSKGSLRQRRRTQRQRRSVLIIAPDGVPACGHFLHHAPLEEAASQNDYSSALELRGDWKEAAVIAGASGDQHQPLQVSQVGDGLPPFDPECSPGYSAPVKGCRGQASAAHEPRWLVQTSSEPRLYHFGSAERA
jgi:ParB-like chromosome segregation protein Spo0J